jgi:hypothetical protein
LLSNIYDWFTEGLDTPDLKSAKALLDELNARASLADRASDFAQSGLPYPSRAKKYG